MSTSTKRQSHTDVWTKEMTTELIQRYKASPELWLPASADYKNRSKRSTAIEAIAADMGFDSKEVVRKLHNLRCQFNTELRKAKKKRGQLGTADNVISSWEYFEPMQFMSVQHDEGTDGNISSLIICNEINQSYETDMPVDVTYAECDTKEAFTLPVSSSPVSRSKSRKLKANKEHAAVLQEEAALNRQSSVTEKPSDEHQIFGDYVAQELRSLTSKELRKKLKIMIQKDIVIVAEEEASCKRNRR